jgi:aspartyl-tRNA(Asn)/glutamyl-tRNA(Gln) amidotransferase subunit A
MVANLTGQPSLSVHAGLDSEGLPVGLQLTGHSREDGLILALGHVLDQAMDAPNFPSSHRMENQ